VPHCKVLGVIGAEIRFQVLLPDGWNGRFLMGGNGGFAGSLDNDFSSVARGYAFADTDTGHQGSGIQAGWAMGHPDRLANYGHVAVHRTADTAKAIARAYYGRAAQYSYFEGCSNGGRQALMEAQRYPQDFDGLVAGLPRTTSRTSPAASSRTSRRCSPPATASGRRWSRPTTSRSWNARHSRRATPRTACATTSSARPTRAGSRSLR
jgi:hypothetical protein